MTTIEIPFDLPDVKIVAIDSSAADTIRLTVASTIVGTKCRRCGRWITQYHGTDRPIVLRHLPILGRKTLVQVCPVRYRCGICHRRPTTTQRLPWYTLRGGHTQAYDVYLVQQVINATIEDVSRREEVGYEAVMGALRRHVATSVNWTDIDYLELLGVDEISLKKGRKDFVTIITGRCHGCVRLLAVLKDRKKAAVKAFFQQIPRRLHPQLVAVCTDLYEGFVTAAREVFGRAKVVADRFHVAKLYRKAVEQRRKQEMRRLKETLTDEEYARLKGVMWSLRKAPKALTKEDHQRLHRLFHHAPVMQAVSTLCQQLTEIFDDATLSLPDARQAIATWVSRVKNTGLRCFKTFVSTREAYWEEVTNYFRNRHSSGFVEGLNTKINVMKRRCYGILNQEHLFQRISLDLDGYGNTARV
jgi:transposase